MSGWQPEQYDPRQHQQREQREQYGHEHPQQTYAQYAQTSPQHKATPPKKRRVFMWVFIAIQVLFVIWIVAGLASHPAGPSSATQAAQQCANGGWQGLFKSQADCQVHYAHALNDAADTGKGLGVALIVVFWCVVDFLTGITWLIIRLSRRGARAY